ncbi:hypothetical protein N7522_000119 [Penicillium canescens]|uniref:Zn(2)-C6 fungal-type domain-containing protein n=1 Tax=Penicillium canescens TaxID=5083 RepID=A0AAD6I8J4_PENCN|nr:uncharacterized protein N7446_012252 [Penicillium canescens]XP_058366956.1 uncharacterized protein N7446_011928 [Penicillium canescens]KAJ6019837.1 hypothetical protein N7522_000545 [Penicillium canescens]KAJ6020044.1 hypothetical protein N7522_000119 [Penicillium canescens]KAJ6037976.1 hypothetical protein N7460_007747 [Penicillium canescens]KAJ6039135.1 hypothetical protein N7460_007167 [Penicillium canescens]KAJ6045388.1 hypothetical protein N7446_012252 [Penicillium canescens]
MPKNKRASCDRCREQKRQCDLSSRMTRREECCSRCEEQGSECRFERSEAILPRKRQRLKLETQCMGSSSHQARDPSVVTSRSSSRRLDVDHEATSADHRESIGPPIEHQDAPFLSPEIPLTTVLLDEAFEYSPQRSRSPLALSSQGASFLHRVFSGKSEPHPSEHIPPVSIDTESPMLEPPISEKSLRR